MAKAKYIQIYIFGGKPADDAELKRTFDTALDWYRFNRDYWIVRSTKTVEEWYDKLKPKLNSDNMMFICSLNIRDSQGWTNKDFWDWLQQDRSNSANVYSVNVYIEPRPKGRPEGTRIDDYVVETAGDQVLGTFKTQKEAIDWAKQNGHSPHVAGVRHLNDKKNPDHWRAV